MGLIKQINLDSGVVLTNGYSVIYQLVQNFYRVSPTLEIKVQTYLDKAAYDSNKLSVCSFSFIVKGQEYESYFSENQLKLLNKSLLSQAYEYLKTKSMYSGAIEQ